jgi:3-oxoacyl-[acyl-carrier protein] reductase
MSEPGPGMDRLVGAVAFVTGGARGIGASICRHLAQGGVRIVFCDQELGSDGRALAEDLADQGALGRSHELDVTDVPALQSAIRATASEFGRLDILVNNAGISRHEALDSISVESWDTVLAVNLRAAFFACQAAAPYLAERGLGRVFNVSSELAHLGAATLAHYTAAKGGLLSLTRSLALALAPAVNVNTVVPGPTDTDMLRRSPLYVPRLDESMPIGRLGTADDIALTVTFLAGAGGDIYTGQQFNANGGIVMV